MVERSFKKCCISNALDGSENDTVYINATDNLENDDSDLDEDPTGDI